MLSQLERNQPDFEASDLTGDTNRALNLWEERGALTDAEVLTHEITELLNEVSTSNNDWDQDRRDAALSLVQALGARPEGLPILNGEQQATIGKSYVSVVENLRADADWLGAPWTAMELGKNVSAILGKEIDFVEGMRLRGQLAEAWSNYVAGVSFSEKVSARPWLEEDMFTQSLRPRLTQLQTEFLGRSNGQSQHESQRTSPPLEKPVGELAIWYGQAVKQNSSAKLAVLRAAPNYLKNLEEKGVDIAAFWNFNDPDAAEKSLNAVLQDPLTTESFKTKFAAKTGSDYATTTSAERRALSDLNLDLVRDIYADLYNRRASYEGVSQRIVGQIDQAQELDNPRAKLRPVLKWIRQIDPNFQSYDTADIRAFIEAHQDNLKAFHEAKYAPMDAALKNIEAALPPQTGIVQFMERGLYDLKSANLTADCTAWNLNDGFNAWTLPVWLTNPNFIFAYINHGNAMVAKFGLLLAFDAEQKPQVIIDSIETNKNLQNVDEESALGAIYAGFVELQKWADRNGFGTLKVCTFTNSQELTANLPIVRDVKDDRQLSFDGLLATEELMRNIGIESERLPSIYLQSSTFEDDDEEQLDHGEYVEGAEDFEALASLALQRSRRANSWISETELLESFRSGDKDMIIDGLIAALAPEFSKAFESVPLEYDALRGLYRNCLKESEDKGSSLEGAFTQAITSLLAHERKMKLDDDKKYKHVNWSFYDDEEAFEQHLEELRVEKQSETDKDEEDELFRSELVPKGLIVTNEDALENFLRSADSVEPDYLQPKYSNVIDLLSDIFGKEDSPTIDIVKAARYVFGTEPQPVEVQETGETLPENIITLQNSMPDYDRREMQRIK